MDGFLIFIYRVFFFPFLIRYASCDKRGFGSLMFPLWFALIGDSFVFLDMGPSILFLVFQVLWLIYGWQGFINILTVVKTHCY